jgi:hypothetical protein
LDIFLQQQPRIARFFLIGTSSSKATNENMKQEQSKNEESRFADNDSFPAFWLFSGTQFADPDSRLSVHASPSRRLCLSAL